MTLRIGNSMVYRRDTVGPRLFSDTGGARAATRTESHYELTVLTGTRQDMSGGREEVFGLVLVAQPFRKMKQATGLASGCKSMRSKAVSIVGESKSSG